jgi:microcystin degradation protein MlrC
MSHRVLLAGLFHETHTFLDGVTRLDDFLVRRREELLLAEDDGSPLAGVMQVAREAGWTVLPAIDLRSTPSAIVEDRVLEEFCSAVGDVIARERPRGIDGVYLVLHGAMACQSYPDVEGEVLERVKGLLGGADIPVCGVLDLHANYSPRMAKLSHGLVAYRENPHTDAQASAIRGARLLDRLMRTSERPTTVFAQPPIVWPPTGVGTANDPMRSLEQIARQIESEHPEILAVNVLAGYSFADTPNTGPAFSAITLGEPSQAAQQLERLARYAVEHRADGNVTDMPIDEVLPHLSKPRVGPLLIVEPADNIGGGAPGDCTGVLRWLLAHGVQNAAVVINDPQSVEQISRYDIGDRATLSIGGKGSSLDPGPVALEVELLSTSDGRFELEDRNSHLASMYGIHINMGPSAVVQHEGVRILLTSRKTPPFDLGQLRSQGLVPETLAVIGVKAAVAHRRAYDKIAGASFTVETPGPCSSNLKTFPFQQIRRPVYPLDEIAG